MAAIVSTIVTVVAAAVSAYAQYQQGQQQQSIANYNARLARQQADLRQQQAAAEAERLATRNKLLQSRNIALASGSGVQPNEGSPLIVLMRDSEQGALDEATARYGGIVDASGLEARARAERFLGASAARAGAIGAGTTLLTGAARVGSRFGGGGGNAGFSLGGFEDSIYGR